MTVNTSDRISGPYTATGGQTDFDIDFPINSGSEVTMYRDRAGTIVALTYPTDFTVVLDGAAPNTAVATLASGAVLADVYTILASTVVRRASDFSEGGDFFASTVNSQEDRQYWIFQETRRDLSRALQLAPTIDPTTFDMTLPADMDAGGVLQVNDDADGWVIGPQAFPTTLQALYFPRVNAGGTAYELIAPTAARDAMSAQPLDSDLTAIAALTTAAFGRSLLTQATAAAARATLGSSTVGDAVFVAANAAAARSALGSTTVGDALFIASDAAAARTTLGTAIGTDVEAHDPTLTALAGVTVAANKLIYATGADAFSTTDFTAAGRALVDDADAAAQRTTLGLVSGGAGDIWVELAGDTMTGRLTLSADPTSSLHAVTKQYVDTLFAGLTNRGQVKIATTANITLSGLQTIDGVLTLAGDYVLAKDQTSAPTRGIYVAAVGSWSRATEFDTFDEVAGSLITVEQGATNSETLWLCSANDGGVLGVDDLLFTSIYPGSGGTVTNIATTEGVTTASGSAISATGTIKLDLSGLTGNAAPALTDPLAYYLTASTVHRKITFQQVFNLINSLASISPATNDRVALYDVSGTAAGYALVSDLLALASGAVVPPQGRLTLTSVTPVLTATASAQATIYYTPYRGNLCPIYGSAFTNTVFAELSLALDSASGHTGYHQSGKNFDLFVINDSGTIRLVTGPAWSSDTARGTGAGTTELELYLGIKVNKNSLAAARFGSASGNTVAVSARQATYVGSFRASADGQTQMIFGGLAAGGTAGSFNLYNEYNRIAQTGVVRDSTDSWTYGTAAWRASNNSSAMRTSYLDGSGEVTARASFDQEAAYNGTDPVIGIGVDSTSAFSGTTAGTFSQDSINAHLGCHYTGVPGVGWHFVSAIEFASADLGSGNCIFYGDFGKASSQNGLIVSVDL